jgi:hypothetical protein
MDLKGLEKRQIFFDADRKAFAARTTDPTREAFALQLYTKICALLEQPKPEQPRYERRLRDVICDFDEARWVPTEGIATTMA